MSTRNTTSPGVDGTGRQSATGRVAQTQARVLDAAQELLARHGVRKVTITEVARAAGVGKGTAYQYWPSKEDVVIAVLAREMARGLERVLARLGEDPSLARASRLASLLIESQQDSELLVQVQDAPEVVLLLTRHTTARDALTAATPLAMCAGVVHELRTHGLVDRRADEGEQVYRLHALMNGFAQASLQPESTALVPDPQRRRALLEQAVHDTLETVGEPDQAALAAAAQGIRAQLEAALASLATLHAPTPENLR